MEDLQSLMTCLDEISNKIGDGMYLDMADKLKRIHDKLNGNKPFHQDDFYYSDDDSEFESEEDDDSDSDFSPNLDRTRLSDIAHLRNQLLDYVKSMHEEYKVLVRWEKEARRTDWTPIKRMTAFRKSQAIKQWCEKNNCWAPGAAHGSWDWEHLVEYGLRTIVLEIGREEEIIRASNDATFSYDELSLKTIQKFPAFQKKIHDDYKEECQRKMNEYFDTAKLKVLEGQGKMSRWEMLCMETEGELRQIDAPILNRDYWNPVAKHFWTGDWMVDDA